MLTHYHHLTIKDGLVMSPKLSPPDSWTLEQLAQKANEEIASRGKDANASPDSRMSDTLTPRNLRRLASEGAIDPPARLGREAYYSQGHLEQVVAARELMTKGFSASAIGSLRKAGSAESSFDPFEARGLLASADFPTEASASASAGGGTSTGVRSTAAALGFLNRLGAAQESVPRLFSASVDLGGNPRSGAGSSVLAQAYHSAVSGSRAKKTGAEAFQVAGLLSSTSLECEPLPGLRLSARVDASRGALTDAQKEQVLGALESLWEQARCGPGSPEKPGWE